MDEVVGKMILSTKRGCFVDEVVGKSWKEPGNVAKRDEEPGKVGKSGGKWGKDGVMSMEW